VGNNPIAIAAPMADDEPFVLDMAQTVVARGRIKLAEMAGEPIPAGWAIDPDGLPTSDPSRALAGALLPFGGYKGYGLALAVEALTGVLAGAGLSPELANTSMTGNPASREGTQPGSVGSFYLALDPEAFTGRAHYEATLARLREGVTSVRRAPGSNEVLFPGELERRATEDARENGVPLARGTVAMLDELAADLDIKIPEPV
jgi:LDH2 family malate/lactate/ureidoglycolate dehydrogenase